ncbi:MAG: spore coat protein [Oscillospiraceae bacterium]|nr:spore coat protein [Oscillospiraceae bacterium]
MASLTSKELTAIEDQLTIEQNVISKYRMYSSGATDGEIKDKCNCIAQKHQRHYDTLISQLQG